MREGTVTVINQLGLHARAAAQLIRTSSKYKSGIVLVNATYNAVADAKSILCVLTLSATSGTTLSLRVEGEDEEAAFEAVSELFTRGFGEL